MLLADAIRETRDLPTVWVCGLAESWAPAFYATGAEGFTSGLVNVFPEISLAVHKTLSLGDFSVARSLIDRIARFESLRTHYRNGANVTVVKEALDLLGISVGRVRLPGVPTLTVEERRDLAEVINAERTTHAEPIQCA
jgi:4-hydroxy-tetrahydrodipicolinate synthase